MKKNLSLFINLCYYGRYGRLYIWSLIYGEYKFVNQS